MQHNGDILQATDPDRAKYSPEKKSAVHAIFEGVLDQLDKMQRAPDHWEETCLVHALNFMEAGLYTHAQKELSDCVLPAGERSCWREEQMQRNPRRYTVARLRSRLDGVRAAIK